MKKIINGTILLLLTCCFMSQTVSGYSNNAFLTWGDCCLVYGPGTDAAFDSPQAITRMMKFWKSRGYTGVYWRTDIPQNDSNEIIRFHGDPLEAMIDLHIRRGVEDTSERFDVLTVARQAAEAEGLEFWACQPSVYSDGAPPWVVQPGYMPWSFVRRYVYDNDEVITVDRNGKKQYLVREYAYPGARASKVQEFVYLAQTYGIKNFYASMRTEAAQTEPAPEHADQFGFNQPVVDAMLARYGVDILTDVRFDYNDPGFSSTDPMVENWHNLRGEYLTRFFRDLRAAMDAIDPGIRIVTAVAGDYIGPELGNWHVDWRTWISEGLIDELIHSTSLQAGWDSTIGKGYLCDPWQGIGVLPVSTYREYIDGSANPQTKIIQPGGWERFNAVSPPAGTDGWQTFWTFEAFEIAWYQRWQQWKKDLDDFGYIKYFEQNFDGFQVNSPGYSGGEGDARYHPELRACPGGWYNLGDGTDNKPNVQNTVSRYGNAIKLTRASDESGSLKVRHISGFDHSSFQSRVDDVISNGTYTLEFWLYRDDIDSAINVWPQYTRYTDTGLNIGLNIPGGSASAIVQLWRSDISAWTNTTYSLPVGQWQKFTLEVDVDAQTYMAYAGIDREITLRPIPITYTAAPNFFDKVLFLPNGPVGGGSCYLDDVCMKWTPKLYYTPSRKYTYLEDGFESLAVGTTANGAYPETGGAWLVSPPAAEGSFLTDGMLSWGDGYFSLAATSNNEAFVYSNASTKLTLDSNQTITVDFDVFLRDGYQAIIGFQKNLIGNVTAAVNLNGKWKCWNDTQFTTTDVDVIGSDGWDVWTHVQMVLHPADENYEVIIQPCGSLPVSLGTFAWDSGTRPNDEVFFVIKPQGANGQTTYVDNISITHGPDCPVGDLSGDCMVNIEDFALFGLNWLSFSPVGDFNDDKKVDFEDVGTFTLNWLEENH